MRQEILVREENGSKRVKMHCVGKSRTRQEFRQECDLRGIIKRFAKTPEGQAALQNNFSYIGSPNFADVSTVFDLRQAREVIQQGNAVFERLPSAVRSRFDNDVVKYFEFVHDPKNRSELISLGLIKPEKSADADTSTPPVKG